MKLRFSQVVAIAFVVMVGFSSCTREYTCQCVIKYTGQPGLPDSVIREYPVKDTKKKAQSVCEGNSGTYQTGDITTTETCKLW